MESGRGRRPQPGEIMARYFILSCDGGGYRGILTAQLLTLLTDDRPALLGKVDLFAGTSTGGLISLALATGGTTPAQLIDIYTEIGAQVFYPDNEVTPLFGAKWTKGLPALEQTVRGIVGNKTLQDLNRNVVIVSFELHGDNNGAPGSWGPAVFTNIATPAQAAVSTTGSPIGLRIVGAAAKTALFDVALSTSAAPTYFPTHNRYVDGGVIANNPALVAVAMARAGTAPPPLSDIYVLSLGTGGPNLHIDVNSNQDWGYLQWLTESQVNVGREALIQVILDASQDVAAFICPKLIGEDHFFRANPILADAIPLDAPQFRQTLLDAAKSYYKNYGAQLRDWVDQNILN
jgi:Patatin-like phospholipase